MKKLLIILMVVAMASFLFVGCLGVTPPVPDEDEEEPVPLPVSEAPYITNIVGIDLFSTVTEYISSGEEGGVLVSGVARTSSVIRIYINDVLVGMGSTGLIGTFTEIVITEAALDEEGEKILYATATEIGLAESVPSTSYTFTLDTIAPEIISVTADISRGTVIVTFDEEIDEDTAEEATWNVENITTPAITIDVETAELTSSKVVELKVDFSTSSEDELILVTCDEIEDLASNLGTDYFEICELEA